MNALGTSTWASPNLASDYLALPASKPVYLCRPIIPRGRLILFVGGSTQGKTPFGYQMARDVAAGKNVLDYFTCSAPCRVGFIDAESSAEDVALRLKMQEHRRADVSDRLLIRHREQVYKEKLNLSTEGLDNLKTFVSDNGLDFLFLDNLFSLSNGVDFSKANLVQPVISGLKKITDLPYSPSVLLFHHPRKSGKEDKKRASILDPNFSFWLEEASGSGVLVNLSDVRLGLERIEVRGEEVTVFRGRSRVPGNEQDIGPLYLTVDEEHALASIDRSAALIQQQGEKIGDVLDLLRTMRRFSVKDALLRGQALDSHPSAKTVRRAIRFAKEHGCLIEPEEGMLTWL